MSKVLENEELMHSLYTHNDFLILLFLLVFFYLEWSLERQFLFTDCNTFQRGF